MTLHDLLENVPPPDAPLHSGPEDRIGHLQEHFGIAFPTDYLGICRRYGSGIFAGSISVMNVFSPSYVVCAEDLLDIFREMRATEGTQRYPYPVHPEKGGVFPWARLLNHVAFWITNPAREQWPTVLWDRDYDRWQIWDMPCSKLLTEALCGNISLAVFSTSRALTPTFEASDGYVS